MQREANAGEIKEEMLVIWQHVACVVKTRQTKKINKTEHDI